MHFPAPDACLYCGSEGGIACTGCLAEMVTLKNSICFLCNRQNLGFCYVSAVCTGDLPTPVYVVGYYEGYAKELISRLKRHNTVAIAQPLTDMMLESIAREYDVIIPVSAST